MGAEGLRKMKWNSQSPIADSQWREVGPPKNGVAATASSFAKATANRRPAVQGVGRHRGGSTGLGVGWRLLFNQRLVTSSPTH
jgi:hypothetical protein